MTVILIESTTIMKREKMLQRPLGAVLRDAGDKTDQVYELASNRRKFCLAHPCRFGKSLLLSTFESLFRHGLRDFRGLAIENLWDEEKTYRVVRLDFTETLGFSDFSAFSEKLRSVLVSAFGQAGFVFDSCSRIPAELALSDWLKTLEDNSLVLLIDEYNAPLQACLDREALFEQVRRELSSFYAVMKSNDDPLRFCFVTRTKTVNQIGIYPEMNHFLDLSLHSDCSEFPGFDREKEAPPWSDGGRPGKVSGVRGQTKRRCCRERPSARLNRRAKACSGRQAFLSGIAAQSRRFIRQLCPIRQADKGLLFHA